MTNAIKLNTFKKNPLNKQLTEIAKLRYIAYLDNNSIDKRSDQIFYDDFDLSSNCYSHIEYIDGTPAAAIRACVLDPKQKANAIPAMEIFSKEIEEVTGANDVIVETNKFVIHPKFQRKGLRLKFGLFSFIFNMSIKAGARYIVSAVREEHVKFYEQMNFYLISEAKRYPGLYFDTVLLAGDVNTFSELSEKIKARLNIQAVAA